jgi:hypothetical protein
MMARRSAYRRTKITAIAVAATATLLAIATDPGSASPATSAAPRAAAFNNGTGSATALGYKVNPTNGNLSFGITAGESVAGHQNTGATGQSRAINLGVIGVTLAGEGCDGGDPTLAADKQPQPVIARSGEEGAAEGKSASEQGVIEKFAKATTAPYAEAITTIAPMGDPAAVFINGGRTISHSGVVNGNTREALARTELGDIDIAGGAIKIKGMVWEAIHRSGAVNQTIGTFSMGSLVIAGKAQTLPGDGFQQAAALKDLLAPLGIAVTPPTVRVEQGIVFVDPLKIAIVPSAQRDSALSQLLSAVQPVRAALTDALLKADCGNSTYITVADLALGSVSGAGQLGLELGGVQATTADFAQFQFGALPALPSLAPVGGSSSTFSGASPSQLGTATAPTAAASADTSAAAPEKVETAPIAKLAGERGGLMALIGGGGLALLLGTAEADRRKMQHALREIPLEA